MGTHRSWHHIYMSSVPVSDPATSRRSCGYCSLHPLCLPAGIGATELQQLEAIVRRRRAVARGERLYRPGAPLAAMYVASEGAFKTVSTSEDGEEQVIGFHLAGELIGLDALGSGAHRYEAVALTAANVCEVPFDQLASIAAQMPRLHHQLLRIIGQGVERDQAHLGILFRRQASNRIALFLHSLSERYRHLGQSSTQFKLPMSREDIARYLGLALETVSRGFTKLQDDGVIESVGRRIDIRDPAALGRLAHSADNEEQRRRRA